MASFGERVTDSVCHRAFSSPEAMVYELLIAPAVRDAVVAQVDGLLPSGRVLDVGAGGGLLAEALAEAAKVRVLER